MRSVFDETDDNSRIPGLLAWSGETGAGQLTKWVIQTSGTVIISMQISRRQFLKNGCLAGVSLSLTSALRPATVVQLCPHEISWGPLENQQLWELVRSGTAPLWVAGHNLNSFARHLRTINLRPELITYLQKAGGEWKVSYRQRGYGRRFRLRFEQADETRFFTS